MTKMTYWERKLWGYIRGRKYITSLYLTQQGSTSLHPSQIKVSHEHYNYPEAKYKGTEFSPEGQKFYSISDPVPSPLHTLKAILFLEHAFLRPNC